jgi:pSer/pThr/pTyr-binding forkhead associated (FHA) protein
MAATSTIDFSIWFHAGCYCGLVACMSAITFNALYTAVLRRGTTRQLAAAIVVCVLSALLLLPALVWYELRFDVEQATTSMLEVQFLLFYVALCGLIIPVGITSIYCIFAEPRTSITSVRIPSQKKRSTQINATGIPHPPRHRPGMPISFVFGEDTPWGWLEYRGGRFQGQRLALTRNIITIGRDENNDIWLDDELASRHHAEIAWDQGHVYVTDCDSMNGVLINGRRIFGSTQLSSNDVIDIGSHRFLFTLAEHDQTPLELSDPLAHHIWHSAQELQSAKNAALPPTVPLEERQKGQQPTSTRLSAFHTNDRQLEMKTPLTQPFSPLPMHLTLADQQVAQTPPPHTTLSPRKLPTSDFDGVTQRHWQETAEIAHVTPPAPLSAPDGAIYIRGGTLAGHIFLLERAVITVGRGIESDIVIEDASISRRHVQFSRQPDGDYVQDMSSRNGTRVNGELLTHPRMLHTGDTITIGNIALEYIPIQQARTMPLSQILTPQPIAYTTSGPMPLRLPSKNRPLP